MLILLVALAICAAIILAGLLYQTIGAALDHKHYPPPGRRIDIGGCRLHFLEKGSGPSVIFESGISATCLNWTAVRDEVAKIARACTYDRASLGWSDPARSPRTPASIVDELHSLLARAGVPPPYILVGHSFGGLLAPIYAIRYPAEVAGLVLVDPLSANEWLQPSPAQARMLRIAVKLSRRGAVLARFGVVRASLTILMAGGKLLPKAIARASSGTGESVISRIVGEVRKMPPDTWPMIRAHWCDPKSFRGLAAHLESLRASSAEAAAAAKVESIPITILSAGNSSPEILAEHEDLARRSPHGRHIVATRSGHWIHLDEPELVVEAIREMVQLTSLS